MKYHYTLDSSLATNANNEKYIKEYPKNNYYENILDNIKHKHEAKYTTSRKFKRDLLEFFGNEYKDKVCLEIGTSQGMSTYVLSYIFKKVIGLEIDDWNIEQAKMNCKNRNNVEIIKFNLYQDKWNFPNDVAVVFIDANHTYECVMSDIINSINLFNDPILVLDDYGNPHAEVKKAIKNLVDQNVLQIIKFIGEKPGDLINASGRRNVDMEGLICRRVK